MDITVRLGRFSDADAICDAHVAAWRAGYTLTMYPKPPVAEVEYERSFRLKAASS